MTDIRPGTRCECGPQGHLHGCDVELHGGLRCDNTAVRFVTVPHTLEVGFTPGPYETWQHNLRLALCSTCAAFHESKEVSRA